MGRAGRERHERSQALTLRQTVPQIQHFALMLTNRFVPLALALIAPFLVNALAFHLFIEPTGRPIVLAFLALLMYLAWVYRKSYRSMLAMRVTPGAE